MSLATYLKDSITEFKDKVEWPKWSELQSSTLVVATASILLSIFTFGIDELFSSAIRNLIKILAGVFN